MKKIILLTGASAGLGKEIAHTLLDKGYIVYCTARRTKLMDDLEAKGGKIIELDVAEAKQVDSVIETIMASEKRLDVLINNAGYGCFGSVEEVSLAEAKRQFDVNLFGSSYLMKKVIPIMRSQNGGRIINISSVAGLYSLPMMAWYAASKYALEAISDGVRYETMKQNIKVSLIEPGPTKSDFSKVALSDFSEDKTLEPYKHLATKITKRKSAFTSVLANTVTKCVLHAIESSKPKVRYIPTKKMAFVVAIRKILPASIIDYFIKKLFC